MIIVRRASKISMKMSKSAIMERGASKSWYFSVIITGIVLEYEHPNFLFRRYDFITEPELAGVTIIAKPDIYTKRLNFPGTIMPKDFNKSFWRMLRKTIEPKRNNKINGRYQKFIL